MKKRILFFIESLRCGGAEKSLISLLQMLDYSRVSVDLMLYVPGGDLLHLVPKEVHFIEMPRNRGLWGKMCAAAYSIRHRLESRRKNRRHGAELLWSTIHSAMPKLHARYDVAIAYQQGLPTYYIARRVNADKKLAWVNTDLKGAGYREEFNQKYYKEYDSVAAVSENLYEKLLTQGYIDPKKLTTVYDILNPAVIRQLADESNPLPPDRRLKIVTVGRMVNHKNYELAVEAAKELRDRGLDFLWTFVGTGDHAHSVEALIEKYNLKGYVHLAGFQINPYPYIKGADIYVQTSSLEGYGLTIAEAKILHRPIVSTDFPVVYDQLTDGVNGLIAKMTPESVAEKIMMLAKDPGLRQQLADATREEDNTTAQTEVRKFYDLIGL